MHAGANPQKGRSRSKLSNGAEGAFHESKASASTYLSLSDAFRGAASRPGQVPKVRHGLAPRGHQLSLASTLHLVIMAAVMVLVMAAVMMLMR